MSVASLPTPSVRTARSPLRIVTSSWSGRIGLAVLAFLLLIAIFGPLVAPHSPIIPVAAPFSTPSAKYPMGTDFLGRDVLSRVLYGGRTVIGYAGAATCIAYVFGITIGLLAGYSRSHLDGFLMRAMDVILAFPPVLFLLVLATGAGENPIVLILGVATTHVPGIARIIRAATAESSVTGYVEAAVARGERRWFILSQEILPNIMPTILADFGVRLTFSILLVASVNFLGLGLQPPTADWALMISENRDGLTINALALAVPAVLIGSLTIAVNLVADSTRRAVGRRQD